jgi:uncharacterized protein (UPF0548 family)
MFRLRKPSTEAIRRFLDSQARLPYSYAAVGATSAAPPAGYAVDHTRIQLGVGSSVFADAKGALERWQQFQLGWVEPCWPDTAIEPGQVVGVLARAYGVWSLNACRIVYVVDERGPVTRFGFAYGTLPEHLESGEERFTIEWRHVDDEVWYDILAFSRPNQLAARVAYPIVRRLQRRFARNSARAMVQATGTPNAPASQPG